MLEDDKMNAAIENYLWNSGKTISEWFYYLNWKTGKIQVFEQKVLQKYQNTYFTMIVKSTIIIKIVYTIKNNSLNWRKRSDPVIKKMLLVSWICIILG